MDQAASRVGVLTTEATKHAMATLVVAMLAERRIHVQDPLYSNDPAGMRIRLREQMETYSAQYKSAPDTFGKERIALSGKVGGIRLSIEINRIGHKFQPSFGGANWREPEGWSCIPL